jgi:hypothetical protein
MPSSLLLSICLLWASNSPPALATPDLAPDLAMAAERIQAQAGTHRLLLLGEMHGTREAPGTVAALATRYAAEGPVVVGLELSELLTPVIDAYLHADGGEAARAALLAPASWHVPRARSDGRRNFQVIELLEQLRLLKAQGREVSVLAFDDPPRATPDSQARDKSMAARIRGAYAALPRGRLLALSGNVHAMRHKPMFAPEMQDTMGSYLIDLEPYSVFINANGGEYWACGDGSCGPVRKSAGAITTELGPDAEFDFVYALPRFTVAELIPE